jgi:hypothetical protein
VKWATGSGWGVDMTASARFSMASRLMRDATNLAGSQDCSAQLRRQDITQLHVLLTLDHFAYRRLQRCSICPASILVIACSRPPTLRILRHRSWAPPGKQTLDSLLHSVPPLHARIATLLPRPDFQILGELSKLEPTSPTIYRIFMYIAPRITRACINRSTSPMIHPSSSRWNSPSAATDGP